MFGPNLAEEFGCAAYVDNIGIYGVSAREKVNAMVDLAAATLDKAGLACPEITYAGEDDVFTGIEIGADGVIRPTRKRAWRL